jgi:hypothetical protein
MHGSDSFGARVRVDALVAANVDPISGQPEAKQTPVRVGPFSAAWRSILWMLIPRVGKYRQVPDGELEQDVESITKQPRHLQPQAEGQRSIGPASEDDHLFDDARGGRVPSRRGYPPFQLDFDNERFRITKEQFCPWCANDFRQR